MAIPYTVKYLIIYPVAGTPGTPAAVPFLTKQVAVSITDLALAILLVEDPATASHALRVTWAVRALNNTASVIVPFLWAVLNRTETVTAYGTDSTLSNMTDTAVETLVDNLINPLLALLTP